MLNFAKLEETVTPRLNLLSGDDHRTRGVTRVNG